MTEEAGRRGAELCVTKHQSTRSPGRPLGRDMGEQHCPACLLVNSRSSSHRQDISTLSVTNTLCLVCLLFRISDFYKFKVINLILVMHV